MNRLMDALTPMIDDMDEGMETIEDLDDTQSEEDPSDIEFPTEYNFCTPTGNAIDLMERYEATRSEQDFTSADQYGLRALKSVLSAHDRAYLIHPAVMGPGGDWKLARFLRSTDHDVTETVRRLYEYAVFRHMWNLDDLRIGDVKDDVIKYQYFFLPEEFKSGDAIICLHLAYPDGVPSTESIARAFLYLAETLDREHAECFSQCGYLVSFKGYKLRHYTNKYERLIVNIIENSYPGRASLSFGIHTPIFARLLYRVISSYVPPHLRKCIVITSAEVLHNVVNPDILPKMLGGNSDYDELQFVKDREQVEGTLAAHKPHRLLSTMLDGMGIPPRRIELERPPGVIKVGPGSKRITAGRWKSYVMVLTEDLLLYYSDADAVQPNNGILLGRSVVVSSRHRMVRGHVLAIRSDQKLYEFGLKSKDERDEWKEVIQRAIGEATVRTEAELRAKAEGPSVE
ncbi:CRAL/TRIO domain [Carpediemonas membranifera]|uniref:CRAL/TRIO domain n=1 Tax=Carpediemonas membranifera TaxID=201153 RepID=A0A8J6BGA0_9EUKA|nr:CRAL/TRIO domain [Carpediemonas membranifera]|eukprot:KAG9396882.1 CRAL/TRIO domain [Carpediemonas membranifera]